MAAFDNRAQDDRQDGFGLSRQARTLWAKTGAAEYSHLWEPLYVHMLDSAGVAGEIWSHWLAASTREFVIAQTGLQSEEVAALVGFLAGVHDIGKATPNFQRKVAERAEKVQEAGLAIPPEVPQSYPHAYMSQIILARWLAERGWDEDEASGLACVVGGHHGAYPSSGDVGELEGEQERRPACVIGKDGWIKTQRELLESMGCLSGFRNVEPDLRRHLIPTSVQVLLTGIVIMADWVASNVTYFPLVEGVGCLADEKTRVSAGWRMLALPGAEHFVKQNLSEEELFRHRFPQLPNGAKLRPVQEAAIRSAYEADEPCLIIIEADTGGGKTEASLLAAEILADKFGEGGLAYLLPTQATSNAMYGRVEQWLETVHADDDPTHLQDIHLLHGKAELNEDWKARASWGESWMGDEDKKSGEANHFGDAIVAHQWFSGHKRGLLAPFVVGTVDQLLFMALNAKHVQLRHLGLAGKVVVIDEVHAYDAYMNVYLDRALAFLGAYHVPVVLLSATLPPARREQLLRAYQGKDSRRVSGRRARHGLAHQLTAPRTSMGGPAYPLVTRGSSLRNSEPAYLPCSADARRTAFRMELLSDDDASLEKCLREYLTDGGCICVLRNTVRRAQQAYELLRERLADLPDIQVELVHSRFIAFDRANNDRRLLEQLGPRSTERPRCLIVVGTQVIEQSLDIDFDMLITDVAPVDLLLQRMGRVHRHRRGIHEEQRPTKLREARCIITGIESWEGGLPHFERGTTFVYLPHILLRTVLAVGLDAPGKSARVTTPDDTAALVERVYAADGSALTVPQEWEPAYGEALKKAETQRLQKEDAAQAWLLHRLPRVDLIGWTSGRTSLSDEVRGSAKVRDSQESIEVVVVIHREGHYELLPWVADEFGVRRSLGCGLEVPPDDVAHAAALCTVGLPASLSAPYIVDGVIKALEGQGRFDGWQESRWLRGQLPLVMDDTPTAVITPLAGAGNSKAARSFTLHYLRGRGLSCEVND